MKRYFLHTIALTMLLSACNKETQMDIISDKMIEFGLSEVQLEGESRGSKPINELPDGSSFGVFGYCLAQRTLEDNTLDPSTGPIPWDSKKVFIKPTLFYQTEVEYSNGVCSYNTPVPWFAPADYLYSFFAYYPCDPNMGFSMISNQETFGAPKIKFTMPVGGANSEDYDLNQHEIPDAMVAQEIDVTRGDGTVPLQFYHILTGLNFQVNNYNENLEDPTLSKQLIIHSLKLRGTFYKSITINFDHSFDYPNETYKGTYSLLSDSKDDDIAIPAGTSVSEIGRTLLLVSNIMQTGKENGYLGDLYLDIEYTFGDHYDNKTFKRPENFLPAGGTVYTAQLNFVGDAFVLNFVVDNDYKWEHEGDSDITFE